MKKAFSLVAFIIFSIMLASVENKVKANTCTEVGLGGCPQYCDDRCKDLHGPTGQGTCDRNQLCTCNYTCGPSPNSLPPRKCYGGAGVCSSACGSQCCNQKCAHKYPAASGFCESLGNTLLCKCQYPC